MHRVKRGIIVETLVVGVMVASVALTARQARPSEASPPSSADGLRTHHALGYYDARIKRVVLVGGEAEPKDGERDKVWSWSGAGWELITADGPPGRVNGAAAYDVRRQRAVVFGGVRKPADGGAYAVVGDTWEEGRSGWHRLADITPRDHQSLVETGAGDVLMYGGIGGERSSPWPSDTWLLEKGAWRRIAGEGPAGRGRTAMAYDSKRGRVVLFGGASAPTGPNGPQTFSGDTWLWDGERWQKVADSGPPGRYAHGMVFDERAGVVLLYSGAAAHRNAPLSDMWQWDGERWTEIRLTGPTPGYRYQPVMVYDRARARTVLYGGIADARDTWEWDGRGWQQIDPRPR